MVQRKDEERRLRLRAERFLPAVDLLVCLETMILEQAREPFAGAAGVACEHDLAPAPAQVADMLCDRFVDVALLRAFGCEVARGLHTEVDDAV